MSIWHLALTAAKILQPSSKHVLAILILGVLIAFADLVLAASLGSIFNLQGIPLDVSQSVGTVLSLHAELIVLSATFIRLALFSLKAFLQTHFAESTGNSLRLRLMKLSLANIDRYESWIRIEFIDTVTRKCQVISTGLYLRFLSVVTEGFVLMILLAPMALAHPAPTIDRKSVV